MNPETTRQELEKTLIAKFPNALIKIDPNSNIGSHCVIEVHDPSFKDMTLLQQHKAVKSALKELLFSKLHAVTLITSSKV